MCSRTALLLPHESVLFNTAVEASAPKRRGSRLLAMTVTPRRLKSRELILTTHRLLCLKRKPGRAVQVRTELFMTPSSEKEKDGRHIISGVEPKGEREFVVMTVSLLVHLTRAARRSYSRRFPRSLPVQ